MVARMMKWPPWPSATRKFRVKMMVQSLKGLSLNSEDEREKRLTVEIRWKGGKLSHFWRKEMKRSVTGESSVGDDGSWQWNEEFENVCVFGVVKDGKESLTFQPWDVSFSVIEQAIPESKSKTSVVGKATLNLSEIVSSPDNQRKSMNIPVTCCKGGMAPEAALLISLDFAEIQNGTDAVDSVSNASTALPLPQAAPLPEKEELATLKATLRKVKILDYVVVGKAKKACREEDGSDGRFSTRSEECEYGESLDGDSADECGEETGENKNDSFRNSFSYGKLSEMNCAEIAFLLDSGGGGSDDHWSSIDVRALESSSCAVEEPCSSESDHGAVQPSVSRLLGWKKRKLNFRSPRARGEPLLNKSYGEEGGDDIDFDRRQLCPSAELPLWKKVDDGVLEGPSECLDFGDDHFMIGSWEHRDIVSRDGQMKLSTAVFFASIDQRSEKAAGESACTTLVAVIADWLHGNKNSMPIKSQFDELIREGSLEWRNLCEIEEYKEKFPDKHFDLDTVLQARGKAHPLTVVAEKSFIGFFQPEGMEDSLEFLQGVMSFDTIWGEITKADTDDLKENEPRIYIVSWNDHFFVLKIEKEAYYIIDTLGERLFEGCNQAYVLKFDAETCVYQLPEPKLDQEKSKLNAAVVASEVSNPSLTETSGCSLLTNESHTEKANAKEDRDTNISGTGKSNGCPEKLLCKGKEACKEFIKGFWAALPLRELQDDVKKGLIKRVGLHHRLQIEFHFTAHSGSAMMEVVAA